MIFVLRNKKAISIESKQSGRLQGDQLLQTNIDEREGL